MARYVDELKTDLKSVAASGWGAELIPADAILQSQFPELVEALATKRARIEELQVLFAAADDEDFEDDEDVGVIAGSEVKRLKEEAKMLAAQIKAMAKTAKAAAGDLLADIYAKSGLPSGVTKGEMKLGGSLTDPDLSGARRIAEIAAKAGADELFAAPIRALAAEGPGIAERMRAIATRLQRHQALENELKELKADLRTAEKKRDVLVETARSKIAPDKARDVILERFRRTLFDTYRAYLDADRRAVMAAIENLHDKYAVAALDIEKKRGIAAAELERYLKVLNYVV
jgi:type I restriction enzyme M protein